MTLMRLHNVTCALRSRGDGGTTPCTCDDARKSLTSRESASTSLWGLFLAVSVTALGADRRELLSSAAMSRLLSVVDEEAAIGE